MNTVAEKIIVYILGILFALPALWLFFWGCNIFVWLTSFGFSFTDIIFSNLPSGPSFIKVVGFIFDGIWVYFLAYSVILIKILEGDDAEVIPKSTFCILTGLLTMVVIFIYDPRIAFHLPNFLEHGIQYLQNNWNFHLVGPFSWAGMDFSGTVSDPFYFTCFDIGIVLSYLFVLFSAFAKV